jgi:uncharacterized delta-60 repeat protein
MRRKALFLGLFLTSIYLPACGGGGGGSAASTAPEGVSTTWVARYNGPVHTIHIRNGYDEATALAVGDNGNVYVTGKSLGLEQTLDYVTIRYDSDGNPLWEARYNGPGNDMDEATALAVDASGNVYVTGGSVGSGATLDYTTIKYDADGNTLWVARYNGPGNATDEAAALAVDANGHVYVTGRSMGSGANHDYATIKYDADGNPLWVARYDGPAHSTDEAAALAVDAGGHVYVTGRSVGSGTNYDYATLKYDADGNPLWVARYNGPGNDTDEATALAVDANGHVYVTGGSMGSGATLDYATTKYDADGNPLWVTRYNGPGNDTDEAAALAVDANGYVYVTGGSVGSGTDYDYATIKHDSNGNPLWVARYNGPWNGYDEAHALAVDAKGHVYVTGGSLGSGADSDYATIKYDADGNSLWEVRYNGPANRTDEAAALAVDAIGNVYVTGRSVGPNLGEDYTTIKYSQPP